MAQSDVTDAGTLIIPGAYSTLKVASSNSGVATTGVLMICGEADAGPDYSLESDLAANSFGPGQFSDVEAKYKSGPIVDAFRGALAAIADPNIAGTFSKIVIAKTNPSVKATADLARFDASDWGVLGDRSYGKLGNLISFQVEAKTEEVVPSTGAFTFLPPIASTNINVRVNGGAATAITIAALATPTAFAAQLDAVPGVDITGGVDRAIVSAASGTLALAIVSGNAVTITRSVAFSALTQPGDTVFISATSVLASVHANNAGSYICTGATATTISATKYLDVTGSPAALTPPSAQTALSIASTTADVRSFSQITASLVDADPTDGIGKTLEVAELSTGTGLLSTLIYTYDSTDGASLATFHSKTDAANINKSAAEYVAKLTASRKADALSETLSAGGSAVLLVGYQGTTASMVNDGETLTITVTGGSGTSPDPISLKDFKTVADLAAYLGSLTGFTAAAATAVLGAQKSTTLDQGTFTFASTWGGTPGRIKQDAYRFFTKVQNDGILVQLDEQPTSGLPAPTAGVSFLSGGTHGATTDALVASAVTAFKLVRGNFVVPLFSRDASDDIADGLTDPASSYTIAAIHANTKSHVLQMSTLKARRNRQGFLSFNGSFDDAKNTSANIGHERFSLNFQDVKDVGADGIVQFQSWMGAVKAAAGQAAAFYQAIFHKSLVISGALQAAGDFNDQDDDDLESALTSGLLPIKRDENGGFFFASDQTTYGKDNNFFFNSIQTVYAGDIVSLTTAQRMEKAFVGQSLADISAGLALTTLEGIMGDLLRLKLIAKSDDAPAGYRNPTIKIKGPEMKVTIEVKVAGSIYFIPIQFAVTQVTQSA